MTGNRSRAIADGGQLPASSRTGPAPGTENPAGTEQAPGRVAPDRCLGATRTSHRWAEMPGNWDRLNTRALFRGDPLWGIPVLPATGPWVPDRLIAYSDRRGTETAAPGSAVHFFLDDYRFETVWAKPERGLSRCARVGAALTPDFSLWADMPLVMQMWQVYRSRWCGAWMLHHGIRVIPTVSWSVPESYRFAFTGIAPGSVVAVSTVGTRNDPEARDLFDAGYAAMLDRLAPAAVLAYGQPPSTEQAAGPPPVHAYRTRWEDR